MTAQPLKRVTSIKLKLGLLVAASVAVAIAVATLGVSEGVPTYLTIPVTVVMALAVTQLLAVGMISPLRQMTEVARRMARGDYTGRVEDDSSDEVGELARAFNQMASDLDEVDRERRDLIATVSHELRTPLASLTARLENMADGVDTPDAETLDRALTSARRLGQLVSDLLDLSRLGSGVSVLEFLPVRPHDIVTDLVAESGARQIRFALDIPADLTVSADPVRLRQLMANLIDNAVRHSPAGGQVHIEVADNLHSWTVDVSDQGPGIASEDRERVFERFGVLSTETGGTGLGLAIARQIAERHGGTVTFLDPEPGRNGARIRATLSRNPDQAPPKETSMSNPPVTHRATAPEKTTVEAPSLVDPFFGRFWPDPMTPGRRDLLLAAVASGTLAGLIVPFRPVGLAMLVVLLAATATVAYASQHRDEPFTRVCIVACVVLCLPVALLDAVWITTLCWLTGGLILLVGLTRGKTVPSFALSLASWPLAGLRGLPWLGRTLKGVGGGGRGLALVRTLLWSLLGLTVFGLLFASADALVAEWIGALLPDWTIDTFVFRSFVGFVVFGLVLAGAYLALNPSRTGIFDFNNDKPVNNRFEWLAPVLLVDGVFALFLAAQAAVFFGGHDYLQRTTGLTYAEYVHQGFGQLTVATALTLLVVWAASRKASRATASDRQALRLALGALCLLALVVVASALHRMNLYQEAFGFTQLRLLVDVFEGWLGLIVTFVLVAGWKLQGRWIPRAALLTAGAALAGLALLNPDAWIARHNIERYQATGNIDVHYLATLSADAVPEVERLPDELEACALPRNWVSEEEDWLSWNLGRERAYALIGPESRTLGC